MPLQTQSLLVCSCILQILLVLYRYCWFVAGIAGSLQVLLVPCRYCWFLAGIAGSLQVLQVLQCGNVTLLPFHSRGLDCKTRRPHGHTIVPFVLFCYITNCEVLVIKLKGAQFEDANYFFTKALWCALFDCAERLKKFGILALF